MENSLFARWEQAETIEQLQSVKNEIKSNRYRNFRLLLEALESEIKRYEDIEAEQHVRRLLRKARRDFPRPGQFSPSWAEIWYELDMRILYKSKVMAAFPLEDREGEWQIILNNPHIHGEVACYPDLPFLEAAYLYARLRTNLHQNECIRMQKIQTVLSDHGSRD